MPFAAARATHVSPAFASAKVAQSDAMPGWVLRAGSAADVLFAAGVANGGGGGGARVYQPPGGEVQSFVPGLRSEQDLKRVGFQKLSWAAVKLPEEAAMRDAQVVVLGVTVTGWGRSMMFRCRSSEA
jgi:hypothetical protein